MDEQTRIEIEAAAFRALRHHLMEKRTDVQNIDLMNLAGFCRNCLSRWYQEAANERGIEMTKEEAAEAEPFRLRVRMVGPGETVESLAATMPYDSYQVERFRVLNGLAPGTRLEPGQWVKTVGD